MIKHINRKVEEDYRYILNADMLLQIYRILWEENIVRFIKDHGMRWFGRLYRQIDKGIKKITEWKPERV